MFKDRVKIESAEQVCCPASKCYPIAVNFEEYLLAESAKSNLLLSTVQKLMQVQIRLHNRESSDHWGLAGSRHLNNKSLLLINPPSVCKRAPLQRHDECKEKS